MDDVDFVDWGEGVGGCMVSSAWREGGVVPPWRKAATCCAHSKGDAGAARTFKILMSKS